MIGSSEFYALKQRILRNYIDSLHNKVVRIDDITKELLKLGDVFDLEELKHLVGLIHYFGIGVVQNKKRAISYFRKIEGLCESLAWLIVAYLQDDPEQDICANPKTAKYFYLRLKRLKSDELPEFYAPYFKFADMVGLFIGSEGNKKPSLKIFKKLRKEADFLGNLELTLLLNAFNQIRAAKDASDDEEAEDNVDRLEMDARGNTVVSLQSYM